LYKLLRGCSAQAAFHWIRRSSSAAPTAVHRPSIHAWHDDRTSHDYIFFYTRSSNIASVHDQSPNINCPPTCRCLPYRLPSPVCPAPIQASTRPPRLYDATWPLCESCIASSAPVPRPSPCDALHPRIPAPRRQTLLKPIWPEIEDEQRIPLRRQQGERSARWLEASTLSPFLSAELGAHLCPPSPSPSLSRFLRRSRTCSYPRHPERGTPTSWTSRPSSPMPTAPFPLFPTRTFSPITKTLHTETTTASQKFRRHGGLAVRRGLRGSTAIDSAGLSLPQAQRHIHLGRGMPARRA
jgi:hypothetical protein